MAPGFIDTDMTRALPEAQRDALLAQHSARRASARRRTSPHAVAFLAVAAAAYITGATLHVNGGMYMA